MGKPIDYLLYQTTPNQHCHLRSPENASVSGADNFIPGIVQCYRTLGTVYMTQSNPKLAYENFRKQIA